jgi:hypothetical protein
LVNKVAFDKRLPPDPLVFSEGDVVKLRNEAHVKGAPCWFGPFEVKKALPNNVYILVDQDGADYLRPVNGNSLRPVSLCSLITNKMWATPPIIALKPRQKNARVAEKMLKIGRNMKTVSKKHI